VSRKRRIDCLYTFWSNTQTSEKYFNFYYLEAMLQFCKQEVVIINYLIWYKTLTDGYNDTEYSYCPKQMLNLEEILIDAAQNDYDCQYWANNESNMPTKTVY